MANKSFAKFFFAFYLAVFIAGMVNVYAAPTVTIVSPNGGEVLSGINTITWTASDSGNSQNLLANLYYSSSVGAKNNEITDVNLMASCDFSTDSFIWDFNADLIAGLPNNLTLARKSLFFEIDNTLYGLIPEVNRVLGYSFTASGWIPNYDINADINAYANPPMTVFTIGASTCYIATNYSGYCWNSSNWIPNFDVNDGNFFGVSKATSFMYGSTLHLLRFGGYGLTGSDWNGDGWNYNNLWATDANTETVGSFEYLDIRNLNGQLILLKNGQSGIASQPTTFPAKIWDGGKWVIYPDYNKNLETLSSTTGATSKYIGFTFQNKYYLISEDQNAAGKVDWNAFNSTQNGINTKTPADCSYSWDTSTALNGYYFMDINATNGVTQSTDSSNGLFSISNLTADDINISCVENCTVLGFDGNAIVINPIDESLQIKFHAQNNEITKSFFVKINNSLKDGKRYFAYTSTPNDSDANYSFDNSLTFGSSAIFTDSIQKIYDGTKFVYTMTEPNLTGSHNKYYLLKYQAPIKQWSAIGNSSEWNKRLLPDTKDLNDLTVDIFQTSSYAFMQNELIEKIPAITSVPAKNLIFLFTGKALTGSNTIYAGQVATSGATAANSATINSTERTYDFQSSAGGFLSQKTPATVSTLKLYDYAIVPAGLFLKNVSVTDLQGNGLPAIIVSGVSWQSLTEGQKYKVNSQIYDQDGTLTKIEVFVYLETVADANLVFYSIFDYVGATVAGQTHNISLEMPGIIDFTANNKKMLVKIRATAGGYSEISSEWLEFVQFPYYQGDFSINSDIQNKIVGKSPEISVLIRDMWPETLRGFTVSFWNDANSPDHSDFNKTYYKDIDFSCNGFDCSFFKTLSEWVFPFSGEWHFTVNALLTTLTEDWNSPRTAITKNFIVSLREFDTFRILEGIDRQTAGLAAAETKYRNDEEMVFILQIRDKNPAINFKYDFDVYFNLWGCAETTGADCNKISGDYIPDSFLYDETTGYNYYFLKRTFIEADGGLLADTNHYRVSASVYDKKGSHGVLLTALLTSKCVSYLAGFIANNLNMNLFGGGCDIDQDAIITDANIAREMRITIDNTLVLTPPKIHAVYCLKNDKSNLFFNPLEQEQLCAVVYSFNNRPIDGFNFIISNNNSDFSKTGANVQYLQSKIPYSLILFNDLGITTQLLSRKDSRPATKLIDLVLQGFDSISPLNMSTNWADQIHFYLANCAGGIPSSTACFFIDANAYNFLTKNFDSDLNLDVSIAAGDFEGILFVKVSGIKTLNIQEYVSRYKELNTINSKDFLEYANYKNYSIQPENITIEYFGNGNTKFFSEEISSPLVINEKLTDMQLKTIDANNAEQNGVKIPIIANLISDLSYNNGINAQRVITPLTYFSQLNKPSDLQELLQNPQNFILKNLIYLATAIIFIAAISVAWYNFTNKGGGSNTVIVRR